MILSKYRTPIFFLIMLFLFAGTFVAVLFAKGYKIDLTKKQIIPNGILAADSNPVGSLVYIDGKLKSATNNTLSLPPKNYLVEIKKDGFKPWKKEVLIQKELVSFADAFLFPEVPDIKPLTLNGAVNPKISSDKARIVYQVPLPSSDAGLWVLDTGDPILFFSKAPRLIAKNSLNFDLTKTNYYWSPNGQQIVLETTIAKYLLDPNNLNNLSLLPNVSNRWEKILNDWQIEEEIKMQARMKKVPKKLQDILKNSAGQINFSPDNTKIMYVATGSAIIPEKLIEPVVSASTQKENRQIYPDKLYVYDIKEDRNFEISNFELQTSNQNSIPTRGLKSAKTAPKLKATPSSSLYPIPYTLAPIPQWFPTSHHLVWINPSAGLGQVKIVACEYDNTNLTEVYSGQFNSPFVFVTPNSGKIIILAEIDFSLPKEVSPTPIKKIKITPTPTIVQTNLFSVSLR